MKTQTPLRDASVEVKPYSGKWDLGQSHTAALGEAVVILDKARPLLTDYAAMTGFGTVHAQIREVLEAIESFAVELRRTASTGAHWRNGN